VIEVHRIINERNERNKRKELISLENAIVMGTFSFIGFHLSTKLLEDGITVHGIDTQIDQECDQVKEEKLMVIGRNANLNQLQKEDWENRLSKQTEKIDTLFYCIDIPTLNDTYQADARQYMIQAIEYCQKHSTKLIVASSIEVVDHQENIITEKSPLLPVTKRGEFYLQLEQLLNIYWLKKSFPYLILRLPTLYGPWQPDSFAFQKALRLKEEGKPVDWVEDYYMGDVLFIEDAITAYIKAATSPHVHEVVHVTSGQIGEWEKGMEIILNKKRKDRSINYKFSNEKAEELLTFRPSVLLEEGLNKQSNHIRQSIGRDW
jgi:UDP-glucose 4-epimerase